MKILITGGAGFIGSNSANHFARLGFKVTVFDNFSRGGSKENMLWLKSSGSEIDLIEGDVSDFSAISECIKRGRFDYVLHLAGQVAVTTSVVNPELDFFSNAVGTFNVLEAIRRISPSSVLIYTSTNKVYGELPDDMFMEKDGRYSYRNLPRGLDESTALNFHSPYGCSKGAADQYVIDYGRVYGLKTFVLRQSCIYGTRQFGIEDQGWVAWFAIAAITRAPINIYGDGKQVRDILHVDDLVNAYERLFKIAKNIDSNFFNIGGGWTNTLSLNELVEQLNRRLGTKLNVTYAEPRVGDQKCFISDNSKLSFITGWAPQIGVDRGLELLLNWVRESRR